MFGRRVGGEGRRSRRRRRGGRGIVPRFAQPEPPIEEVAIPEQIAARPYRCGSAYSGASVIRLNHHVPTRTLKAMTVRRIRVVLGPPSATGNVHEFRCETPESVESGSVALRPLDPAVHVLGVALKCEARLRLADGRTFDGYGANEASAFQAAHDQAIAAGVLSHSAWRALASAFASAGAFGEDARRRPELS
jgi:hypothetical protein